MRAELTRRLRAAGGLAASLARVAGDARRAYGAGRLATARRALALSRGRGFGFRESYELGLLDPRADGVDPREVASKREAFALQNALNPPGWHLTVQDKGLFGRLCERAGLPSPRLLALWFDSAPGWSPADGALRGEAAWTDFLRRLPDECVLKPSLGYHGRSVRILTRRGDRFVDQEGTVRAPADLYRLLRDDPEFRAFVIQERLRNDPELARLSGTHHLQTVRAVTLVDGAGRPRLLKALLRVIVGGAGTDNYRGGRSGNLLAPVDPDRGTLGPAASVDADRPGVRRLDRHPDTGVPFGGLVLPRWEAARALALEAAEAFLPLRTVGWDVAITPDGAVLVEGNNWWDPLNPVGGWGAVMDALRAEAAEPDAGAGSRGPTGADGRGPWSRPGRERGPRRRRWRTSS